MSNETTNPMDVPVVVDDGAQLFAMSTTDYDVFVFDPANRPIERRRVEMIKASIQKRNLLRSFPIIVSTVGGEWVVRDGQHRLTAARELGVPIYYTFNDDMTSEDSARAASTARGWNALDMLHHYCVLGYPEYLRLRDFMRRYPWLTLHIAMALCAYGDRPSINRGFVAGTYRCNDLWFAEEVAAAALQFSRWIPFYRETTFVFTVAQLLEHDGYDHARMLRKMEYQSARLVKCVSVEQYMAIFNVIYNAQQKEADRLLLQKLNPASVRRRPDRRNRPDAIKKDGLQR